ncbi:MAG: extracellular solute-binding protein [Bacteroidota bacterium]
MMTSKHKWSIAFIVILVVVYLVLLFIQKENNGTEVIEIYFADRITAAHKILIDEYNQLNKGKIKVVPIDFPNFDFSTNERKEVLARSLRGTGDGIDLFAVDIIWVQRFAKWCEPLDKYFTEDEKKRILPQALASCYSQGELVAVPLDLVQGIMYYREDLLKELVNGEEIINKISNDITWEEFLKVHSILKKENPFYIYPAADYEGLICSYIELVLSLKLNYFEEYGFNFEKPEAEKALQLLVDLVNKFRTTPKEVTKYTEIPSYQHFIKNDGFFIRGWPSYDKDFRELPVDLEKEKKLKKAPLPHFKEGEPTSVFGGWNLMISKFSDKKQAVVDFVKFLLSDKSQEIFFREGGYYPIINKIYEDSSYSKKYPELLQIRKLLASGVHRPAHEDYTRYSKIMSSYIVQAINNDISVKDALRMITSSIQLEKNVVKEF